MSTTIPYICSRCLRASTQTAKSNALNATARAYSTRVATRSSRALDGLAINCRTSALPRQPNRLLSTSRSLYKPALESQNDSKVEPAPPPPSTSASTPSSSSAAQQYNTTTLLNPRTDEETGEPMEIGITPRAIRRLSQIMLKDANPNLTLRVTVESGGCHGFQYLMSLVDASKINEEEDVLFVASTPDAPLPEDGGGDGWRSVAEGRPKVVIDESSLELLKGSRVDYTMELIGSQFKIDNPRASSSCGCGTSFDVKI